MMISSKVIRDNRRHITRADYGDTMPVLGSENIRFPQIGSLQSRALRQLLVGQMLSHRDFDSATHTYRLSAYVDNLREKGWPIVDHDEAALTQDRVKRTAIFTRYELFAAFEPELLERIKAFCKAVDDFKARATGKAA